MAKAAIKRYRSIQLVQLALAVACCVWVLYHYVDLKHRGNSMIANQTEQLARSLTSLAALNAATHLGQYQAPEQKAEQKQLSQIELQDLVDTLRKEYFIRDAQIMNHQGVPVARSEGSLQLEQILPLAGASHTPIEGIGRRPYLAEIRDEQRNLLGYLRVTLEHASLQADSRAYLDDGEAQVMRMFLASIAIGFFLTRVLSRKRRWAAIFNIQSRAQKKKAKQAKQLVADIAARSSQDS